MAAGLARRPIVKTVHVRHDQQQVGVDEGGQAGGQAVVVVDADHALHVQLLAGLGRDGVVGVEDGDDVEVEQLLQGRLQVLARVLVVEVELVDENLALINGQRTLHEHGRDAKQGMGYIPS